MKTEEKADYLIQICKDFNLESEQKTQLINEAVQEAGKILLTAFYICQLENGIKSTIENNGVRFEINLRKVTT